MLLFSSFSWYDSNLQKINMTSSVVVSHVSLVPSVYGHFFKIQTFDEKEIPYDSMCALVKMMDGCCLNCHKGTGLAEMVSFHLIH